MNLEELIAHLRTRLGRKWTRGERRLLWDLMPAGCTLDKARTKHDPAAQARYLDQLEAHCAWLVMSRLDDRTPQQRWQDDVEFTGKQIDRMIVDECTDFHSTKRRDLQEDSRPVLWTAWHETAYESAAADRVRRQDRRHQEAEGRAAQTAKAAQQSKIARR